ncbi:hypothetical protein EDC04DRAFT_1483704 [Pisolithus marmoratus]|nr:hypothetical protein EDC04DRAFT_1483704 [Pisolithus marmoratus]
MTVASFKLEKESGNTSLPSVTHRHHLFYIRPYSHHSSRISKIRRFPGLQVQYPVPRMFSQEGAVWKNDNIPARLCNLPLCRQYSNSSLFTPKERIPSSSRGNSAQTRGPYCRSLASDACRPPRIEPSQLLLVDTGSKPKVTWISKPLLHLDNYFRQFETSRGKIRRTPTLMSTSDTWPKPVADDPPSPAQKKSITTAPTRLSTTGRTLTK